jgi:hypothetical protein
MQHIEPEHDLKVFTMADCKSNVASSNRCQNLWAARSGRRGDRFDNGPSEQLVAVDGKFCEESGFVFEVMRWRAARDSDLPSDLSK